MRKLALFIAAILFATPAVAGDATSLVWTDTGGTTNCPVTLASGSTCIFLFGAGNATNGNTGSTQHISVSNGAGALICLNPNIGTDGTNPNSVTVDVNYSPISALTDEDDLHLPYLQNMDGSECQIVPPGVFWVTYAGSGSNGSRLSVRARW